MHLTVPVRIVVNWVNSREEVTGVSSMATKISGGVSCRPLRDSSSDTTAWRTTHLITIQIYHMVLFENEKICKFTVKTPHPHNGHGVLHLKTPSHAR